MVILAAEDFSPIRRAHETVNQRRRISSIFRSANAAYWNLYPIGR